MNAITILGIILFLAVIGFVFWLLWKWGHQNALNAKEYNRYYIVIDVYIDKLPKSESNHSYISRMLDSLRDLKYKDTARTIKLIDKFNAKFEPEASRIMKEHLKKDSAEQG